MHDRFVLRNVQKGLGFYEDGHILRCIGASEPTATYALEHSLGY